MRPFIAMSIAGLLPRSRRGFRLLVLLFAGLLGAQSVWLLLAELCRADVKQLPLSASGAAAAARQRSGALWAATFGRIRGQLWAEAAFTYADLAVATNQAHNDKNLAEQLAEARACLLSAVTRAPHQAEAWLLLAALASRYPSLAIDATQTLKMSYYTGPTEHQLIPLRLMLATRPAPLNDVDVRQFIVRDVRLLLAQQRTGAIQEAYSAASLAGKEAIEQTVEKIDPTIVGSLRTAPQRQF